ncbi:unnamed protein product [Adineta steineri]|uniref:Uncharacterized protein n=3 Tax=Adineta steineri TaxID=433720 RepID=A0A815HP83_9BILA|nr:unnamed protein product [Adineta steineri]
MTDSSCSCCKLLGKPPARVNFIMTTGVPDSLVYERIEYLLENYSESSSSANDISVTNYKTLMDISQHLFDIQKHSLSNDLSAASETQTCCHGFTTISITNDDISDSSKLKTLEKVILNYLDPKGDLETEQKNTTSKPETWIMLDGSACLEPPVLSIFSRLQNHSSPLLNFSLTILCFLVDEQRLFENWLNQNISIHDYQSNTYPKYERLMNNFFPLLNSSTYLQQNTLLIEEQTVLTDHELQTLIKNLYHNKSTKYRATNVQLRHNMAKLLSPRQRTVRDIRNVRSNLQKNYDQFIKNRLRPLFNELQQSQTAASAARQIVNIVLNEFERMNEEELRVYKRQLILGFEFYKADHSNTIASQLVHYALQLLKNNDDTSIPFIYSIVLVICKLGTHFYFRHELFNNTPEIYTLSLMLVSQRQYALTLCGLRLCITILNGDQNEHKYALAYLTHDSLAARKILDAVKWLLSPYIILKNLWKDEKENEVSEVNKEESALHKAERCCFQHAGILVGRAYISSITSLYYGSADHCALVTEDDVRNFLEVINILATPRLANWSRGENKSRLCLELVGHLCAFLTPILQYSLPSVCSVLLNHDDLLVTIPKTIRYLITADEDMANICVRFYTRFVQLKCKQEQVDNDIEDEKQEESSNKLVDVPILSSSDSLNLSKDLISAYFDLHQRIQKTTSIDENVKQQEQIKILFNQEWTKLNVIQLQHDHQQLQHQNNLLNDELSQLRSQLQRTQAERDEFRKENMNMAQQIDNLKLMPVTSVNLQSQQSSVSVSTHDNNQESIIDKLQNLSAHDITTEQAEACIQEIYHRRTTFNDHDMRKSICGSLKHLGSDLYSSPVHFLHELIQNAEDNFYTNTTIPCLRIELNHSYILLSNNEQGLRVQDVLALCSLAVSTKTSQQQHIGEKGVGFKSVFAASNQPILFSHTWKFAFHVPGIDAMSYITPLWIKDQDIPDYISKQILTNTQDTHLYLPLKYQAHTTEADLFLNQVTKAVDPCILLNMRQLKKLEIIDQRQNKLTIIEKQLIGPTKLAQQSKVTFEDFTFTDLNGSIIQLCTSLGYHTFRVYTCYIDVPNSIEQRRSSKTRLIMAFPCENNYCLTSTVYAGLPVCDLGFNFVFNADFQLVTNRENVRENVPFNSFIRDHLSALFVYLLLNDLDLRKDISRYCPSSNTHQIKHSSWWLVMIDSINELITKYLSILFDIQTGKSIRYLNKDLTSLVSNEQLYNCADIQVINSDDSFLTSERLKSFQIQTVSIMDVLNCFPNQEATNEFQQQFKLWAQNQNEQWWSQLFHHINQIITSEISDKILSKPIFLLQHDHQRQYLPKTDTIRLLFFITDDASFRIWKRQLILLRYSSTSERDVLLKSNHIQLLTEERMIEIIRLDHLQLSLSSSIINTDIKLIEEIWNDLFYLKSRLDKLNKSTPFLVPTSGTTNLVSIQNAILPTIFGIDIQSFMYPTTLPIILLKYLNFHHDHQLMNILEWEHFFLEMNCQRPSVYLSRDYTIDKLPLLPTFTMFQDEKCAQLGEMILLSQTENTKDCLCHFPIVDNSQNEQQISPVSATFDELIVRDLPSLPRITIPPYCRRLALNLNVCVEYDLRTCVTILQLLSNEKNTNINLYIQWLGHLQLYVRRQHDQFNSKELLSSCYLYLPDQNEFYSLKQLLVISDNEKYHNGILLVSKYLKLQIISPSINQIYWQFKDLFQFLGCTCTINISYIYQTIYSATLDKTNFFALGDCQTILTENGMESMIILFQYLENLLLDCVKENKQNSADLYHAIVERKHLTAPCGSREDLEWRFSFTCNSLSQQLKQLSGLQTQQNEIGLLTIDRQLIKQENNKNIYACLETKIIQNLSRDIGKRYFISPVITQTCPLVLAIFQIDYVERRGKLEWIHKNHNLEYGLTQLTEIFRNTLADIKIEVITAKYASVTLLFSDTFVIDSIDEQNEDDIERYMVDSDYPFWIFNNIILLCTGSEQHNSSKAIIATSALTTLLHKRKYLPFEEAKSIARQKISTCRAFRSEQISNVASAATAIYSYTDLLFPTDHHTIESMIISIGKHCSIEQDQEDNTLTTIAADRTAIDKIYRNLTNTQHHIPRHESNPNNWTDPSIVDGIEQITIGRNAEHFFFTYLQKCYGSVDVTPTKNWRSSSRLINHPNCRRNIDDSVGYDFELHDTREIFVHGTGSITKYCYFEVKGTSGLFHKAHTLFHISDNELRTCEAIANDGKKREREAYFIVIIQNCLDAEKISFGTTINWSDDFWMVQNTPDSYRCRIVSPQSTNFNHSRTEEPRNQNRQQQQLPQQSQAVRSDGRYNNSAAQPTFSNSGNAASTHYNQQQQSPQQSQAVRPIRRHHNSATQPTFTNSGNTASPHPNQQQQFQAARPDRRHNNSAPQSSFANSGNEASTQYNSWTYYNQQQHGQIRYNNDSSNDTRRQQTQRKNR